MDKFYFLEILLKYQQGHATKEEIQFLISYYNLFDEESDAMALLDENQKDRLKSDIHASIWNNIKSNKYRTKKTKIINAGMVKMAAAFLLPIAIVSIVLVLTRQSVVQTEDRVQINNIIQFNKHKEHQMLFLPDGSTVIISAGSKLKYPSSFDSMMKREVYLEGQAFFDISHNTAKPFIVHTGKIETTVLGTAFNIKAWPGNTDIIVTVIRGKVKVGDEQKILGIITPNEQIVFNKKEKKAIQRKVNTHPFLAWKEQDILFEDITVAEAAKLLEDRFNVHIYFNDESISAMRFTTTFMKDESLEQVLNSICEFNNASYSYDKVKARVTITVK
ncbi:MAG: FecR domain-containing protein [Segetibacter sp.]